MKGACVISQFSYVIDEQGNEVFVGTEKDIKEMFPDREKHIFNTEEELLGGIRNFRENERIISVVSDLPVLNEHWKDKDNM
ncbi:hypothetical protein ACFOLK_08735 [Marinococcus halophilus]|uniref:hypothetical protein n=1 Tax=Marinococcus halophilus TaxID=1371 RepID=UPI00361F6CE5